MLKVGLSVIYSNNLSNGYPQEEINIIIIIFAIVLIVLFIHLIFRLFRIYSRGKPKTSNPEIPEVKLKKIPTPKFKLMAGGIYLVLERTEEEADQGFKIFKDILRSGDSKGLLISRTYPEKILKKLKLGKIPVLWLSRSDKKNSISPTNLGAILEELKDFAKRNENSIIMFDGLEYLTVHNKFERVLKFIHSLEDEIAVHGSRLIISLNPTTLPNKKVALLSKEMKVLNINGKSRDAKMNRSKKK
jgi:hypothetical protein